MFISNFSVLFLPCKLVFINIMFIDIHEFNNSLLIGLPLVIEIVLFTCAKIYLNCNLKF